MRRWWLSVGLCAAACASAPEPGPKPCSGAPPLATRVFGGKRPMTLEVPKDDDPSCPMPLLLLLHGYGATGELQKLYFDLGPLVDAKRVLLAAPDGLVDSAGRGFWNGTDACCNEDRVELDDVGYLQGLVDEIAAAHAVDRRRVFVLGHSNGGFMGYRLACDRAGTVAAVVSLAGATFLDGARCAPNSPVSVLQIHGDQDAVILYDGGQGPLSDGGVDPPYPSAPRTAALWAGYDGCSSQTQAGGTLDLEGSLPGEETTVTRHLGCPDGVGVELWTLRGGGHVPVLSRSFLPAVWRWLEQHPKP